ncbi:VF530 family protein [Acerihabitans sp. TG2]|uniref:VF530 family protein n=1 Tax=Acerihabitans sp. TG2 TaxID=3096008 RepID=UPI002B232CD8|nr:VF530 family protein [Acerihabitans sp. TG2]MEA9389314.1 VF530 family protein [Acerihabitans sp. TG2]
MNTSPSKDPLHGKTLEMLVNELVTHFGWAELAKRVNINCFKNDPSVKSSLKFLRRTPWARAEVEALYLDLLSELETSKTNSPTGGPWSHWHGNKEAPRSE